MENRVIPTAVKECACERYTHLVIPSDIASGTSLCGSRGNFSGTYYPLADQEDFLEFLQAEGITICPECLRVLQAFATAVLGREFPSLP